MGWGRDMYQCEHCGDIFEDWAEWVEHQSK